MNQHLRPLGAAFGLALTAAAASAQYETTPSDARRSDSTRRSTLLRGRRIFLHLAAVAGLSATAVAADAPPGWILGSLPAWLTDFSLSDREAYDSNVFGVDNQRAFSGGVLPLANRDSAANTAGLKFGAVLGPLLGGGKDALNLSYAPEMTWFDSAAVENFSQQKFGVVSKGSSKGWSWSLDNNATFIGGQKESFANNGTNYSFFGIALPRERLDQWQDRNTTWLRYDAGPGFLRVAGSLLYYDLHDNLIKPVAAFTGYQNFIDRYDVNGGFDAGYLMGDQTYLTLGWRNGSQFQGTVPGSTLEASNHYERIMAGVEGTPASWLNLKFTAGPDFRHYETAADLANENPTTLFLDGNLSATLDPADTLAMTVKKFRFVSSNGKFTYDDKNLQLTWKHKVSDSWNFSVGPQFQAADFAGFARRDDLYAAAAQIQWLPAKSWSLTLDALLQEGRNAIDSGNNLRNFDRNYTGLTARYLF
jgi:hypothetical protein